MKSVSEVHFRVIDKGIFLPIALRLAREAGHVSYWTPHEKAFPSVKDIIGDGFEEIERVESPWQDKESVGCWVFPDIGFSRMQRELFLQGYLVWGSRDADALEISRGKFIDSLMETDLPVPPYKKVVGMTALREHLVDKQDKFIKVSRFRGDWETLHWRDWAQDESELDSRSVKLGPWKEFVPFYVFDQIEAEIEDGCDTHNIDGKFPSRVIHGVECKDRAYLGAFQPYADLPEEVRRVTDAYGPVLARNGYRNFFSAEVRITKERESYFIDPTLRAGSPPSQVMTEMIANLGEIIWRGAQGELVDPEPVAQFGVQALLCVKGSRDAWSTVVFPPELKQWVKCGFCSQIGRALVFPPDREASSGDIGWLVGIGDTPKEAIRHLRENADLLPSGVSCEYAALTEIIEEVEQAKAAGLEVTPGQLPTPGEVVESES